MTVLLYIAIILFCESEINGSVFFHASNESKNSPPNAIKFDSSPNISTPKSVSKSASLKPKSYEMPRQSLKAKTQISPNQTLNTAQKTGLQPTSDFKSVKNSTSKSAISKPTFDPISNVPQKTKRTNKPLSNSQILSTNSLQIPKKTVLQKQDHEKYQKPITKTINSSTLPYKDRSIRIPKTHQSKATNSPSLSEIKSTEGSTKLSSKPTSRSWGIKSPKISITSKNHSSIPTSSDSSMTDSIKTKSMSHDTKEENNTETLTRKNTFTNTQKRKDSTESINSEKTIKSKEKPNHDYTRGKATYYTEWSSSPGSCGMIPSVKNIVALSPKYMKASCGKCISISYGAKVVKALVTDTCAGCSSEWIDLSDSLFRELAPLENGVLKVGWSFTEC